jgi:hypothetical protein
MGFPCCASQTSPITFSFSRFEDCAEDCSSEILELVIAMVCSDPLALSFHKERLAEDTKKNDPEAAD